MILNLSNKMINYCLNFCWSERILVMQTDKSIFQCTFSGYHIDNTGMLYVVVEQTVCIYTCLIKDTPKAVLIPAHHEV